jgi:hypothetical protein
MRRLLRAVGCALCILLACFMIVGFVSLLGRLEWGNAIATALSAAIVIYLSWQWSK